MTTDHKHCPSCGEDKPLDQFGKDKSRPDGLFCYCKECKRSRDRKKYQADPEAAREKMRRNHHLKAGDRNAKQRARYHADGEASREQLRRRYRKSPRKYRKMKRLEYERNKVRSVAGRMPTWRAAEVLKMPEAKLQYLAGKHRISLGFYHRHWSPEQEAELIGMYQQGQTQQHIAASLGRSLTAVNWHLVKLRKENRIN